MTDKKQCNRCKVIKDIGEFDDNTKCKLCVEYCRTYYANNRKREIGRATRSQNKDRNKTNAYKRNLNRSTPLNICLQQARRRAKLKNIPFNISIDDLEIPSICPVLGITLQVNTVHAKDNSYSLDRIIPELGYVKGNVEVISHKANSIKNNASIEELEKVLCWLKEKLNEKESKNYF